MNTLSPHESVLRTGIIGHGAIGLIMGKYLNLNRVDLIASSTDKKNISELTLPRFFTRKQILYSPKVMSLADKVHCVEGVFFKVKELQHQRLDLLIMPVKCYQVSSLLSTLKQTLSPNTVLFLLQNGLGGAEQIRRVLPQTPLLVGTTTDAGYKLNDHDVQQTAVGNLQFGWFDEIRSSQSDIVEKDIAQWHPNAIFVEYIHKALFEKVAINAIINTLCAIFDVPNGDLLDRPQEVNALFEEVWCAVQKLCAHHKGFSLNKSDLHQKILNVMQLTAKNSCSMREDIKNGRKTEIDGILGYLLSVDTQAKYTLIRDYNNKIKKLERDA